jgi:shikimate kinase
MVIYLTGFMGSGKTTLGRKLAGLTGLRFIDTDNEIETSEGRSIAAIFSEEGEKYFRKFEYSVLRSLNKEGGAIIATGGGTPCHADNMDYMNATGITVYLKMSPKALASRLPQAGSSRPLIDKLEGEALLRFIEEKISEREPYYLRSQIVFDGIDADPRALLEEIRSVSGPAAG